MGSPAVRKYLEWATRNARPPRVVVTLLLAATLFLVGVPFLLNLAADSLDRLMGLPRFDGLATSIAAALLVLTGGALAFWSVLAEVRVGIGTPVPMVPTRRLVVEPPFTSCRNPMVLGTSVAYLGMGVWLGSAAAVILVVLFAGLLLLYVKVFEERELEARFGAEYVEYRRTTPFLIPRRPPRQRRD